MTSLKDKVAIITGSTSGIGKAIAQLLAENGVKVIINSVSSVEKGQSFAKELPQSIYCKGDIGKETDCKRLIETTIKKFGRLDFLINNAGTSGRFPNNETRKISNEAFSQILNTNVVGTWCLIREALPHLTQSGNGVIINITSCVATDTAALSSSFPYGVYKAAINYMTQVLARELGPEIRVNAIAPGVIKTPRTEGYTIALEKFENRTPLKRIGETNDIAEIALALIKSNYINGEIIVVDGGFSTC